MSKANKGNKARNVRRRRYKAWKWLHNKDQCRSCKGTGIRISYGRGLKQHLVCYCVQRGHPGRRW